MQTVSGLLQLIFPTNLQYKTLANLADHELLYPTRYNASSSGVLLLLAIWFSRTNRSVFDIIDCKYDFGGRLNFIDEAARNDFQEFANKYEARFDFDPNKQLIPIMKFGAFNGFLLPDINIGLVNNLYRGNNHMNEEDISKLFLHWRWIFENAKGKVVRTHNGWFFELTEDAATFKLFHGSDDASEEDSEEDYDGPKNSPILTMCRETEDEDDDCDNLCSIKKKLSKVRKFISKYFGTLL